MSETITQLLSARLIAEAKDLTINQIYLFSFQINETGIIRIITTNDVELYYADIHNFFLQWANISSIGWAKDKKTFYKMLEELKGSSSL